MEERDAIEETNNSAFGPLLLDVGISLLKAGASASRIKIVLSRLAEVYHYVPHITIGSSVISLVLDDSDGNMMFNRSRSTPVHGIDFNVISTISRLSIAAEEKKMTLQELEKELIKSQSPQRYPRIITLCFVGLAGAAFCYTFGGSYTEMLITFGATFCGLFVKQQLTKSNFNSYLCTYVAATTASFFVGLFHATGLVVSPIDAFSACVLFLIPGVLLINSFIDLIDGNTINGIVRLVNALIHILAIAIGLFTTIGILNLKG
ncbi:MAG: hypothetical protein C5B59_19715 [Bacteroidetes bacterium]|nr:MAG: hypothetical protein C5B59_19715 [Bacteroidota bacterium]